MSWVSGSIGLDGRLAVRDRVLEPVALGVVVQQLDDQILLGHGSAHERVAALALGVREGEVGVALERHVALLEEALARRALPLAAAVDEVVALAEGGVEDRLVGRAVDLLADRLEADLHGTATLGRAAVLQPAVLQSPLGRPSSRATRMFGETNSRSCLRMSLSFQRRSSRRWGWLISVSPSARTKPRSLITSLASQPW